MKKKIKKIITKALAQCEKINGYDAPPEAKNARKFDACFNALIDIAAALNGEDA